MLFDEIPLSVFRGRDMDVARGFCWVFLLDEMLREGFAGCSLPRLLTMAFGLALLTWIWRWMDGNDIV